MYPGGNLIVSGGLKVSEVVFDNPAILLLLEHFNLSVPFQEKTITGICTENNLNPEVFITFAELYYGHNTTTPLPFTYLEIESVIGFLKSSHNYYIHEKYPEIRQNLVQLYEINNQKEITLVERFFNEYYNEVAEHLKYEDEIVFPYISGLQQYISGKRPNGEITAYSVLEYKEHHNDIEDKLNDLKNLLIKYLPGKNDQHIRRKLFLSLSELEFDLNIHAKIEDRILIPLVEKMELDLKALR